MSLDYTPVSQGLMIEGALHLEEPEENSLPVSTCTSDDFQRTPSLSAPLGGNEATVEKNELLKYPTVSAFSIDPHPNPARVPSCSGESCKSGLLEVAHTTLETQKPGTRTVIAAGTWHRLKSDIFMWKWEVLACLTSLSAMVILLVGAFQFQSSKLANWPYLVNVNSVVSWCIMISKTCMLFSVAGCINQLKWRWFRHKKPLAAMDSFDEASRGPWGALTLLIRIREFHLVSLGAIITLFALIMDPLIQSFIAVQEIPHTSHDTRIKYLQHYKPALGSDEENSGMDHPLRLALIQGLSLSSPTLEYGCPRNGICNWQTVSLALCHECQNITDLTNFSNITSADTIHLPNGEWMQLSNDSKPDWVLRATTDYRSPDFDLGHPNSFMGISVLTRTEAYTCSVFFCVNAYSTEVSYGMFSENITASWDSRYANVSGGADFELPQNNFSSAFNNNRNYSVGSFGLRTIGDGFLTLFNGRYPPLYDRFDSTTSINAFTTMDVFSVQNSLVPELENFLSIVANVTNCLSFALRGSPGSEFYPGESSVMQTILSVQWKWLAFPMAFPVLTLVLLIATVVTSAKDKVPIWKSSQSPLLLHGLSEELQEKHANVDTLSEIKTNAKDIRVELVDTGAGWRLV